MIGGEDGRDGLQDVGEETDGHPEAGEKAHGEIDQVGDSSRRGGWSEEGHGEAEAGERDGTGGGEESDVCELGEGDGDVTERDAEEGEDGDDDERKDDGHDALGEDVGERRHGAGLLELEPAGAAVHGYSDTDAEDGGTEGAEDGVATEEIFGDRDSGADVLVAVHDEAEEAVEHDGEADGGEGEGTGAEGSDDLETHLGEEDAEGSGEGAGLRGGESYGCGGHGAAPERQGLGIKEQGLGRLVGGEGEEGVFEGGAGDFEGVEGWVEGEEFAEGGLGFGGGEGGEGGDGFDGGDAGDGEERGGGDGDGGGAADDLEGAAGGVSGGGGAEGFDFGGCSFADDAPLVDDDDAVGEGVGFFEVVGGEEDGFAAGGEGADLGPHAAAGFDVEADGGLVQEEEVGVAGEGKGEEDSLLLAAGELAEHAGLDAFECRGSDDVGVGHGVGVVAAEDVYVLADAEHLGGPANLEHDAGAEAGGGEARVGGEDADAAAGGRAEAHE